MTTTSPSELGPPGVGPSADVQVFLPDLDGDLQLDQDEEWCEALIDGQRTRIRFHDYHLLYDIPGMYERIFYDMLRCTSPSVVSNLLARVLTEQKMKPGELRVLDVGAGNGMVGEKVRALGVGAIHGIDIIKEAAVAARRDRPEAYDDYLVADLTDLTSEQRDALLANDLNTMTTVAALGFGDIPPAAFAGAFNLISTPGLLAFTIKEDFVSADDPSGFSQMIQRMFAEKVIVPLAEEHYQHRLSIRGEPLYYVAFVARKLRDVPPDWPDWLG